MELEQEVIHSTQMSIANLKQHEDDVKIMQSTSSKDFELLQKFGLHWIRPHMLHDTFMSFHFSFKQKIRLFHKQEAIPEHIVIYSLNGVKYKGKIVSHIVTCNSTQCLLTNIELRSSTFYKSTADINPLEYGTFFPWNEYVLSKDICLLASKLIDQLYDGANIVESLKVSYSLSENHFQLIAWEENQTKCLLISFST